MSNKNQRLINILSEVNSTLEGMTLKAKGEAKKKRIMDLIRFVQNAIAVSNKEEAIFTFADGVNFDIDSDDLAEVALDNSDII